MSLRLIVRALALGVGAGVTGFAATTGIALGAAEAAAEGVALAMASGTAEKVGDGGDGAATTVGAWVLRVR